MNRLACLSRLAWRYAFRPNSRVYVPEGAIAVDTHVHLRRHRQPVADLESRLLTAAARGMSGIAATDHNTMDAVADLQETARQLIENGSLPKHFFIIPGEEIGSTSGHILALYIKKAIPKKLTARETVDAIHADGGLAVAPHPMMNRHMPALIRELPFDAVECKNAAEVMQLLLGFGRGWKQAADYYAGLEEPCLGGSDAHDARTVATCYTIAYCAPTPEAFRSAVVSGRIAAMSCIDHRLPPDNQLRV